MEDWLKPMLAEEFFDFILYVNIRKNAYLKRFEKKDMPYSLPEQGAYEEFLHIMKDMLFSSMEEFTENMKLIRVLGTLEYKKKYTVLCRLKIKECIYDKKIVFFYGEREKTVIVFCEDLTDIVGGTDEDPHSEKRRQEETEDETVRLKKRIACFAHEIRTSLHSIYGNLSVLKLEASRENSYLDNAVYAAEHLLHLMNSVLDVSVLENDIGVMKIEASDLEELVQFPRKISAQQAQEKGIQLEFYCGSPVYKYLYLNKDIVWHILINLLSNAIKYTNGGGKVVCRITEIYLEEKRVKLLLEVTDTGIGIEEDFLSDIWNAYTREYRMKGILGSGLGLMLTKRMVELLHGSIDIISRVGLGTKVSVELEVDGDDVLYARPASPADKKTTAQGRSPVLIKRALVAEDEESNMEIICRYLEQLGVAADRAYNGKDAIEIFEKSHTDYYHIILMDINMPGTDGIEAIRRIRNMERTDKTLPIIAVTAEIPGKEKEGALSAQIDGYLIKPYRMEDIRSVLLEYQK